MIKGALSPFSEFAQFSAKNAASANNVRRLRIFFDMSDGADR